MNQPIIFALKLLWIFVFLFLGNVTAKKPPLILILTDDLDTGVFEKNLRLQNLLTLQGVKFAHHLVPVSLCCPSRISILRGQVSHNTGIYGNFPPEGGFEKVYQEGLENSTLATWLHEAGYRTAYIGKYLNGYPATAPEMYIPPGWDRWWSPIAGTPYKEYDYTVNDNGKSVYYGTSESDYGVDVISQKAAKFIRHTVKNYPQQPFFLVVAPQIPHAPATPPVRYLNSFPDEQAPRTLSFNEADVTDKPNWVQTQPLLTSSQIEGIDRLYRNRRASMKSVKDLVQNILETLEETGQLGKTYLFFTSDNGYHQGQHRLFSGKNTGYEEDLLTPLVVRGPQVLQGKIYSRLTGNIDLAPTFAELAGITLPDFVDGRSLAPLLHGSETGPWRKGFLLEHRDPGITKEIFSSHLSLEPPDDFDFQMRQSGGVPLFLGLRTVKNIFGSHGPLSYIEYETGEKELYDLEVDPYQLQNKQGSRPALQAKLSRWIDSLRTASGAEFRAAEETPPPSSRRESVRKKFLPS